MSTSNATDWHGHSHQLFISFALSIVAALSFFLSFPTSASAASITASTRQLTPGAPACTQPLATNFRPYAYDGDLHSFDVDISDKSYVAVGATVGETAVPFIQMRRGMLPDGSFRIHADIETTPLARSMPITIMLLAAPGPNAPICLSQIVITETGSGTATVYEQIPQTVATTGTHPRATAASRKSPSMAVSSTSTATTSSLKAAGDSVAKAFTRAKDSVRQNACGAGTNTSRLWFIFLVLYVLSLGAIALSRPPSSEPYPLSWLVSAILIPLILLAAFWYVLSVCGVSAWVPILAVVAGIAGIVIALRGTSDDESSMLLLPEHDVPSTAPSTQQALPTIAMPAAHEKEASPAHTPAPSSAMQIKQHDLPATRPEQDTKPVPTPEKNPGGQRSGGRP
ncbi:DUF805 domain-containing protein [Candidatus Kaiserbacteria bacterium]|nr:DUF805 domain-containing protein [Candidatus Kaiserbacteria bacterium]